MIHQPKRDLKTESRPTLLLAAVFLLSLLFPIWLDSAAAAEAGLPAELARIKSGVAALRQGAGLRNGREIYRAACAGCHGVKGDGRGISAAGFQFAATDFRAGIFKLRGTKLESLPTDEDLFRTTHQGMPGTEMVPFGRILTPESIRAVVAYIKSFSADFADPSKQLRKEEIVAPPRARSSGSSGAGVAAGRELFEREECHSCHGSEGDGRGPDAEGMTDDWDRPLAMFDFADGRFKSGTTDADLFRTITTGMNGTPMESYLDSTSEQERWQLVDFIRSLEKKRGGFFRYLLGDRPSGLNYTP